MSARACRRCAAGAMGSVTNAGEGIPLLIVEVMPPTWLSALLFAAFVGGSIAAARQGAAETGV
jgi:hypothetical protein